MTDKKICNRCGKEHQQLESTFDFGFRKELLSLCEACSRTVRESEKKLYEKYMKKLVKLTNKYFALIQK